MPAGNGTGPQGFGPMTGRRAGYCSGNNAPGYATAGGRGGRGFGEGFYGGRRGGGFGRGGRGGFYGQGQPGYGGNRWYGTPPNPYPYTPPELKPEDEINILKQEAANIKREMDAINERIQELEKLSSGKDEK